MATGNYNDKTARIYEDFGLLTCDAGIAHDVGELFNFLTGFARDVEYRTIIVSPTHDAPAGPRAHRAPARPRGRAGAIDMKVNGLTDPAVIDALYEASGAGVAIRLAVRTLCCLRPGVAGLSREHHGAQRGRRVPRAQPDLLLRPPGRARLLDLPRLGGPDGAQPRPPRRGAGARSTSADNQRRAARRLRDHLAPTTSSPGCWAPTGAGAGSSRSTTSRAQARVQAAGAGSGPAPLASRS